jgi:hypothetical protein
MLKVIHDSLIRWKEWTAAIATDNKERTGRINNPEKSYRLLLFCKYYYFPFVPELPPSCKI